MLFMLVFLFFLLSQIMLTSLFIKLLQFKEKVIICFEHVDAIIITQSSSF